MTKISFWRGSVVCAVWVSCALCALNLPANDKNSFETNSFGAGARNSLENDKNAFDTNSVQNLQSSPANTMPQQIPPQTLSANDERKIFFVDFGIGYTRVNYTATQRALGNIYVKEGITTDIYERQGYAKKGVGNGADMLLTLNLRLMQRFGVNIGGGGEFVAVKWHSPLLDYNYRDNNTGESVAERRFSIDSVSKDTFKSLYFTLGVFYELWQGKERAVRLFGNVGWGVSEFAKSSFETDFHTKNPVYDAEGRISQRFYTLGVRYIFAKRHGIELSSRLGGKFIMDDKTAVKTNITWKPTLNLRYVWEF